jgi:hypothetical protein
MRGRLRAARRSGAGVGGRREQRSATQTVALLVLVVLIVAFGAEVGWLLTAGRARAR